MTFNPDMVLIRVYLSFGLTWLSRFPKKATLRNSISEVDWAKVLICVFACYDLLERCLFEQVSFEQWSSTEMVMFRCWFKLVSFSLWVLLSTCRDLFKFWAFNWHFSFHDKLFTHCCAFISSLSDGLFNIWGWHC